MRAFAAYLRALLEQKRAYPKDDLISALVRAEEAGDKLSEEELLGTVVLLLIAGHETTANLVGIGMLELLQHPDQFERLKEEPFLIGPAVEELLRYSSPFEKASERFAREDVRIGEVLIPKDEMVLVVIAAANRDPERFPDPDALDITRADNKHLAFGKGIHFCLGTPLARTEGQIAIGTLLRRMSDLRLKDPPEELTWRPGLLFRSLRRLPVEF
jgi:cytochrome P450